MCWQTRTSTGDRDSRPLPSSSETEPEFRDLTLYYFGDTEPKWYGVVGKAHVVNAVDDPSKLPALSTVATRYLGGLGVAAVGAVGTARLLPAAQRRPASPDERGHHDRHLPNGGSDSGLPP